MCISGAARPSLSNLSKQICQLLLASLDANYYVRSKLHNYMAAINFVLLFSQLCSMLNEGRSTILTIYSEAVPAAVQDAVIINAEPKSTQIASCEVRHRAHKEH